MSKIKIGVVGCGKQAVKHVKGFQSLGLDIDLYVSDLDSDLAESFAESYGVTNAGTFDNLLAVPQLHAIDLCTPVSVHYDQALAALSAGKHLFCEKPLVLNADQAVALEDAREKRGLVGMVGYIYRFVPMFEEFKRLSSTEKFSTAFGKPVVANFRIGGRGSHQLWKHQKVAGGGAVNEMLVHMVDLALWFFGEPESIRLINCERLLSERQISGKTYSVDAEDFIQVEFKMASGVLVNLQADMLTPSFTQYAEIQGDKGTFVGSIQNAHNSYLYLQGPVEGYAAGVNDLRDLGGQVDLYTLQMRQFVQAFTGRSDKVSSTILDSIRLIKTIDKIKEFLK